VEEGEKEKSGEGYVWKVNEETRRFAKELLTENERLRHLVAGLQKEGRDLEGALSTLRAEVDHCRREEVALKRQMTEIREENQSFSQKYLEVEIQNSNLANLYVASYRLHATLDRQEILNSIKEIIINLIGSEEFGIFECDAGESTLSLTASAGIDATRHRRIPVGEGRIGETARTAKIYLAGGEEEPSASPEEAPLLACIPLKVDGKVTGVIAIFRLLQHKTALEAVDQEMFDLLATHAAVALYCAGLHARMTAGVKGSV
jgi:nitrate/nitrite-specific signal transduction histidine kinase